MNVEARQDSPSPNLPRWVRGFALLGGGLVIFFGLLLILAMNSGPTVAFNTGPGGTGATLSDHKVGITATLNLSVAPQPYYGNPHDSQFYYQSNGLLSWLEAAQDLRPGVGWRGWQAQGGRASIQLAGLGAEEGSAIDAGLVFSATDGNQYLFLTQPEDRQISWYRWQGQPGELLDTATYRPSFGPALATLLGEVALVFFYAVGALLIIALLALLLRWLLGLTTRRIRVNLSVELAPTSLRFFPLMLFALTLFLTGYVAYAVLDAMPHVQDSAAYIFQARQFAGLRLLVPDPGTGLHDFLDHSYVLFYNGAWFSKYPPGYPLALALGVLIGQPAIIDPLCAALALVFIYLTGTRLFGMTVGVLAALLGLLSPFFLTMSGAILSHSASMLGTAAFLYFFVVANTTPPPPSPTAAGEGVSPALRLSRWERDFAPLLAGLSIGWVVITRELTALGIAAPFVIYALVDLARHRDWPTMRRYLLMVAGALPPLLFLLLDNYVLTGGPLNFPQNLQNDFDRVGFGPGHGGDVQVGHTPQMGLTNAVIYLRELAKDLFGWPAPFAFVFVWFAFLPDFSFRAISEQALSAPANVIAAPGRVPPAPTTAIHNSQFTIHNSASAWRLLLIGAALGLASAYFFWWAAARIFGPRYWYEMLPFLLLLTALGVVKAGRWVGRLVGAPGAGRAASGLLLTLLIAYSLLQFTPQYVNSFRDYNNMTPAERDTVAQAGLHHAVVFVQLDAQTARRDYSRVFWLNDPLLTHSADIIWLRDEGMDKDKAAMQQYFPGWSGWLVNRTVLKQIQLKAES